MRKGICVFFFSLFILTGCFQSRSSEEEELRTVPVTNNPLLLPSGAQDMPGIPTGTPR